MERGSHHCLNEKNPSHYFLISDIFQNGCLSDSSTLKQIFIILSYYRPQNHTLF